MDVVAEKERLRATTASFISSLRKQAAKYKKRAHGRKRHFQPVFQKVFEEDISDDDIEDDELEVHSVVELNDVVQQETEGVEEPRKATRGELRLPRLPLSEGDKPNKNAKVALKVSAQEGEKALALAQAKHRLYKLYHKRGSLISATEAAYLKQNASDTKVIAVMKVRRRNRCWPPVAR